MGPQAGDEPFQSIISCCRKGCHVLPAAPTGCPGNVTPLRSGSGRLRLGRLGSGGNPPGRGISPAVEGKSVSHQQPDRAASTMAAAILVPELVSHANLGCS